jgi:hypothetical protein
VPRIWRKSAVKRTCLAINVGFVFLYGMGILRSAEVANRPTGPDDKQKLIDYVNALSRLQFALAAERYAANTNRNETWILTVHEGDSIRMHSDKKYTVLSLPITRSLDRAALCQYVEQYNSGNLHAADHMVKDGKFREAAELYRLLLHFDRCGGLYREMLEKRLPLLERLERGEDVEVNRKAFTEFAKFYGVPPFSYFTEIEKTKPLVVTNLLEVRSP